MALDVEVLKTAGIVIGGILVGGFTVYRYLRNNFPVDPNSKNGLSAAIRNLEKRIEDDYLTIKDYKAYEETTALKHKLELQETFIMRNQALNLQFKELHDQVMGNRDVVIEQYSNLLEEIKKMR